MILISFLLSVSVTELLTRVVGMSIDTKRQHERNKKDPMFFGVHSPNNNNSAISSQRKMFRSAATASVTITSATAVVATGGINVNSKNVANASTNDLDANGSLSLSSINPNQMYS